MMLMLLFYNLRQYYHSFMQHIEVHGFHDYVFLSRFCLFYSLLYNLVSSRAVFIVNLESSFEQNC